LKPGVIKAVAGLVLAGIAAAAPAQDQRWKAQRVEDDTGYVTYRLQSPASISNPLHLAVLWDESCQPYGVLLVMRAEKIASKARDGTTQINVSISVKDGTALATEVAFLDEKVRNWITLSIYPYPEEIETILKAVRAGDMIDVVIWGDDETRIIEGHVMTQGLKEAKNKLDDRCMQDKLMSEIE